MFRSLMAWIFRKQLQKYKEEAEQRKKERMDTIFSRTQRGSNV